VDIVTAPLVPAYHLSCLEITELLNRLPEGLGTPFVVYNDDDSRMREHLESLERGGQLRAVYVPLQVGKAEAVRQGLQMLLDMSAADVIVQVDGHLKQPPEEVPELVCHLVETGLQMVVTNRYGFQNLRGQTHRSTISGLLSDIVEQLTGYKLHDVVCGTRAYVRSLAQQFLHVRSFGYGLEVEEVLIAASEGLSVGECPTRSNLQASATNAEKIEDNLFALINYANETRMPDNTRAMLCFMLTRVKQRTSFDVDTAVFGTSGVVRFEYIGDGGSIANGYASGTAADGYSLFQASQGQT